MGTDSNNIKGLDYDWFTGELTFTIRCAGHGMSGLLPQNYKTIKIYGGVLKWRKKKT